jgi:hypothetical protein
MREDGASPRGRMQPDHTCPRYFDHGVVPSPAPAVLWIPVLKDVT